MGLVTGRTGGGFIVNNPSSQDLSAASTLPITNPSMDTAIVDTRWAPSKSLMPYVGGSSLTVDAYYSQVLGANDQVTDLSPSVGPVYQQYVKILNLEIKVTNPLSAQQNQDDKTFEYSGSGIIYGGVIPNDGDIFVVSIGDNQKTCFKVTSEKTSVFKRSVYLVNFTVVSSDKKYLDGLEAKVVDTYVFRKDHFTTGQNPLVTTLENDALMSAARLIDRVSNQYINRFYDPDTSTLTLTENVSKLYDHFLAEFVLKTFPVTCHTRMQSLCVLSVKENPIMLQDNLFRALLKGDAGYLNTGFTKITIATPLYFTSGLITDSIRLSGVNNCVVPVDPVQCLNISGDGIYQQPSGFGGDVFLPPAVDTQISKEKEKALTDVISKQVLDGNFLGIYPIHQDGYYVFSSNFYNDTDKQSTFELEVRKFITGKKIDLLRVYNTLATYTRWSPIEQFYLIPISITLLRAAMRQGGF